jgi:hypothetical protein
MATSFRSASAKMIRLLRPWRTKLMRREDIMSLRSLNQAADECFLESMPPTRTREQHEAAIAVWNEILDEASANAARAKARYIQEQRYEHAALARDMAEYFNAMKATKEAPFRPAM